MYRGRRKLGQKRIPTAPGEVGEGDAIPIAVWISFGVNVNLVICAYLDSTVHTHDDEVSEDSGRDD